MGGYFIAERMREKKIRIPLMAISLTGETLYDTQREVIEEVFDCRIFETYGLSECVVAGYECEKHEGFHTASKFGIIELERDPATELYRVIGTSIWNDVMPFIRYEIEDLVEASEKSMCSCGKGLPIQIKKVTGRIDDIIFSTKGLSIMPVTLRMHIKPLLKNYETYQIIQVGKREYRFVITGEVDESREKLFLKTLLPILGEDAKVYIESVQNLLSSGGKVRNVINLFRGERN